jgi:MFS family permease
METSIAAPSGLVRTLAPMMAIVFVAFLIIGMAMPVVPLYVHEGLGLGTFMVGIAAGCEFVAALLSRFWSGRYADTRGAKRAIVAGLLMGAVAGLLYLGSLQLAHSPTVALLVLLLGRVMLGGAESFVITGALAWALARGGHHQAGSVISWVGTALWSAYAAGAPIGTALYGAYGFVAIALATMVLPLVTLFLVIPLPTVPPAPGAAKARMTQVVAAVSVPGLGLALTAVGFATINTFGALLFAERRWPGAWLAFTALSGTFLLGRLVLGHLPDRIGGARVALASVIVEALGQAPIWLAPTRGLVFAGAAVTGLGYSLVYPGFGLEAVRRSPPQSRGLAMGAFTASSICRWASRARRSAWWRTTPGSARCS